MCLEIKQPVYKLTSGVSIMAQHVKLPQATPKSLTGTVDFSAALPPIELSANGLEKQQRMAKILGPQYPFGIPRTNS